MRRRLTGFLRQTTNAIQASKLRDQRRARGGRPPKPSGPAELVVGGVRIQYSPAMDGDADPGEIVWGWVAYEDDPTQGKDRPIVVIGRRGRELAGLPLTSRQDDRDPQVPVGSGPWDREGRPSWVRLDRLLVLDPSKVRREGAILPRDRFDAVIEALQHLPPG